MLLAGLLLPAFAAAAPFCAVNGAGTTCTFYDVHTCRTAAGFGGACVANSNEARPDGGSSQRPPIKFIDRNPITDSIESSAQRPREGAIRKLEMEQQRDDRDLPSIEAPVPAPPTTQAPIATPNTSLVLVCNLRVSGNKQIEEVTFTFNLANQTVKFGEQSTSDPARISDNLIEWEHYGKQGTKYFTSINRLTGSLSGRVGKDDIQGKCAAFSQASRKF